MKYDIILSKDGDRYGAQVSLLPQIQVWERSRERALALIKTRLQTYLKQVEWAQVEIETPEAQNPWLEHFGSFVDDPTFDEWQAETAKYRQARDAE